MYKFELRIMKKILFLLLFINGTYAAQALEIVQLRLPKSDKVVIKVMFRNGSMSDPKGMEGLTSLTTSLLIDGGTEKMSSGQIKDIMYPWAARVSSSVDKEVSVFTFEYHKDHEAVMLPLIRDFFLRPGFHEEDFQRLKSNQLNYV